MAFIFYFAVLLVAAASALFGLDLMTSPLPPSKSPTQQFAGRPSTKLAQREADQKEADAKQASTNDRALSPVLPAAPGNKEVRMVYPPTNGAAVPKVGSTKPAETTGSASADNSAAPNNSASNSVAARAEAQRPQPQQAQAPQAPPQAQAPQTPPPQPQNPQPVAAAPAQPKPQPVVATTQGAGHCDIQACAAAYHSFRASDCTYQPFGGERRLCEKPPQVTASRAVEHANPRSFDRRAEGAVRPVRKNAELDAVAQRVKQITSGDDDEYDDRPLRGRRVIVIQRGYGDRDDYDD